MIEQLDTVELLKWVVVVFCAGFIGFFGKYLGRVVISFFGRKTQPWERTASPPEAENPPEQTPGQDPKLLKKALKTRAKLEKKKGKS